MPNDNDKTYMAYSQENWKISKKSHNARSFFTTQILNLTAKQISLHDNSFISQFTSEVYALVVMVVFLFFLDFEIFSFLVILIFF